jgi:hypothetical protein
MGRFAKVTSLDAIQQLQGALGRFAGEADEAVTLLVLEVRRAVDWLEQDRRRYWPQQVRRAEDRLTEARNDLHRCQLKYGSGEVPACSEQKEAVERAVRRLRLCQEKVQTTRDWIRQLRQEVHEFEGQIARMHALLETDIPRATAALGRMLEALERYADGRGPHTDTSASAAVDTSRPVSPPFKDQVE